MTSLKLISSSKPLNETTSTRDAIPFFFKITLFLWGQGNTVQMINIITVHVFILMGQDCLRKKDNYPLPFQEYEISSKCKLMYIKMSSANSMSQHQRVNRRFSRPLAALTCLWLFLDIFLMSRVQLMAVSVARRRNLPSPYNDGCDHLSAEPAICS